MKVRDLKRYSGRFTPAQLQALRAEANTGGEAAWQILSTALDAELAQRQGARELDVEALSDLNTFTPHLLLSALGSISKIERLHDGQGYDLGSEQSVWRRGRWYVLTGQGEEQRFKAASELVVEWLERMG